MSDRNERACTRCGSLIHHEDDMRCDPPLLVGYVNELRATLNRARRFARAWKECARKADLMSASGWWEVELAWDERHAVNQRAERADGMFRAADAERGALAVKCNELGVQLDDARKQRDEALEQETRERRARIDAEARIHGPATSARGGDDGSASSR